MTEKATIVISEPIGKDFQPKVTELQFGERILSYQTFPYRTYTIDGTPVDITAIFGYREESGFPFFPSEVLIEMEEAIEAHGGNRTIFTAPKE